MLEEKQKVQIKEDEVVSSDKNSLKGLEEQMEQNDNQLDGIINNLPEEKESIFEKIKKNLSEQEQKKRKLECELELE